MATDDETMVRGRVRPKSTILDMLDREAGTAAGPDHGEKGDGAAAEEKAGPESFDPTSTDYKAFGWANNKSVPTLRFILKDLTEIACCYAHLDSHYPGGSTFSPSMPGKGNVIRLRFAGHSVVFFVILEGRNLRRMWELIQSHLTGWIHEYPAAIDDAPEGEAVVTSIGFELEKS